MGGNPFKFGLIGSTDSHVSLATADNDNYWGKHILALPSATRMLQSGSALQAAAVGWEAAAGYAAVWAEENTRESIFAAMRRKEVYASTGPRMTVRFFGGWEYSSDDVYRADFVRIGYSGGVPMGGDLSAAHQDYFRNDAVEKLVKKAEFWRSGLLKTAGKMKLTENLGHGHVTWGVGSARNINQARHDAFNGACSQMRALFPRKKINFPLLARKQQIVSVKIDIDGQLFDLLEVAQWEKGSQLKRAFTLSPTRSQK